MSPHHRTCIGILVALGLGACDPPEVEAPPILEERSQFLYGVENNYWTTSSIPVCWENSGNPTAKGWVEDELTGPNSWSAFADVQFTGWNRCTSSTFQGIRITSGNDMAVNDGYGQSPSDGDSDMILQFSNNPQNKFTR
ncbi:MAG: hypothetical protein AAF211_24980, partial [Myxococcota bacterium]